MHPLITCDELTANLEKVVVIDIRWALTDPTHGHNTYLAGHIPGAVFADLDRDLADPPGEGGRHPLPSVENFARTLGRLGISPESHVVTYDDMGGTIAARLWWMLRSIGHQTVQILDGGYQAWVEEGHPTETGEVSPTPETYPTPEGFSGVVDRHNLLGKTLIDARQSERFRGEVEPVDPKPGRIPGAVNRPVAGNLGPDGRFRDAAELAALYADLDNPVVSCGSGVTACHDAVAMVVAGYDLPALYPGSYSEWSGLDLPVETGP